MYGKKFLEMRYNSAVSAGTGLKESLENFLTHPKHWGFDMYCFTPLKCPTDFAHELTADCTLVLKEQQQEQKRSLLRKDFVYMPAKTLELAEEEKEKEESLQDFIDYDNDYFAIGESKIGGFPDLPKNYKLQGQANQDNEENEEEELQFIMQINLNYLQPFDYAQHFTHSGGGMLYFFIANAERDHDTYVIPNHTLNTKGTDGSNTTSMIIFKLSNEQIKSMGGLERRIVKKKQEQENQQQQQGDKTNNKPYCCRPKKLKFYSRFKPLLPSEAAGEVEHFQKKNHKKSKKPSAAEQALETFLQDYYYKKASNGELEVSNEQEKEELNKYFTYYLKPVWTRITSTTLKLLGDEMHSIEETLQMNSTEEEEMKEQLNEYLKARTVHQFKQLSYDEFQNQRLMDEYIEQNGDLYKQSEWDLVHRRNTLHSALWQDKYDSDMHEEEIQQKQKAIDKLDQQIEQAKAAELEPKSKSANWMKAAEAAGKAQIAFDKCKEQCAKYSTFKWFNSRTYGSKKNSVDETVAQVIQNKLQFAANPNTQFEEKKAFVRVVFTKDDANPQQVNDCRLQYVLDQETKFLVVDTAKWKIVDQKKSRINALLGTIYVGNDGKVLLTIKAKKYWQSAPLALFISNQSHILNKSVKEIHDTYYKNTALYSYVGYEFDTKSEYCARASDYHTVAKKYRTLCKLPAYELDHDYYEQQYYIYAHASDYRQDVVKTAVLFHTCD